MLQPTQILFSEKNQYIFKHTYLTSRVPRAKVASPNKIHIYFRSHSVHFQDHQVTKSGQCILLKLHILTILRPWKEDPWMVGINILNASCCSLALQPDLAPANQPNVTITSEEHHVVTVTNICVNRMSRWWEGIRICNGKGSNIFVSLLTKWSLTVLLSHRIPVTTAGCQMMCHF